MLARRQQRPAADARPVHRGRLTQWASELPGFGTRSYASGRRIYVVQARMDGRTRTVTIGDARVISRVQALDVARRVLVRAQVGENPADVLMSTRRVPRFDAFLSEFWGNVSPRWKPSTLDRNIYYRRHLERGFARRFLDKIEPADVSHWFAGLSAKSGPAAANRSLQLLGEVFNKADAWGVIPANSNPCTQIRRNPTRKHECMLSDAEFSRFGSALADLRVSAPMEADAIRLIALTGCRKGEICGLDWSEVRGRRLLLHDAKTGPRTVWLGTAAAELLERMPRHADLSSVFWIADKPLTVARMDGAYRRARLAAGLAHVRMHDLRHSFASHAAAMSETLPMISKLLGHSSVKMTARYAHLSDGAAIEDNERIGRLISKLMELPDERTTRNFPRYTRE